MIWLNSQLTLVKIILIVNFHAEYIYIVFFQIIQETETLGRESCLLSSRGN